MAESMVGFRLRTCQATEFRMETPKTRRRLKIFFDGGCRPNPGRIEAAVVVQELGGMAVFGAAGAYSPLGLLDHLERIANAKSLDSLWFAGLLSTLAFPAKLLIGPLSSIQSTFKAIEYRALSVEGCEPSCQIGSNRLHTPFNSNRRFDGTHEVYPYRGLAAGEAVRKI